jgi:hypothetical protein
VSLAGVSDHNNAVNAAWRILGYKAFPDPGRPGSVIIEVGIQVHDADAFLERLSFFVVGLG